MLADLIVRNAGEVLTCAGPAPRRGADQKQASTVAGGAVASFRGRIVFVGTTDECDRRTDPVPGARVVEAAGGAVIPGFVDPHTHVVYAGDRRAELRQRLAGRTYMEIAAEGGGILSTVRETRAASEEELVAAALLRLDDMLSCGTTTAEAKSGYGLDTDSELRMLRAIRTLGERQPISLVATFLGAHEVPPEHRASREEYVRLLVEEMIPEVARQGLAEWCDVFCETGVFTPAESETILRAGLHAGLKARIHADEMGSSGGSEVAANVGARSADHLLFVGAESAGRMASAGVVATLLPAAAFYLKIGRFAPARMLIDRGVPVALATDINPGGGFTTSMAFVVTLACFAMKMTFEEALVGATINAAYSIDRHESVGSLEVGKEMDAIVLEGPAVELIRVGTPAIKTVIKGGRVVRPR